ncbi:MAG: SufD family Fe-S cluster assembly protein [Parachlamydiales bacterium]|jgi:Fe-S cluster assembly scaffold protein SufB
MKCLNCFKNSLFFQALEKQACGERETVFSKSAREKLQKLLLNPEPFDQKLPLCRLYDKKPKFLSPKGPVLKKTDIKKYLRQESRDSVLVFLNGVWQKELSSFTGLTVESFDGGPKPAGFPSAVKNSDLPAFQKSGLEDLWNLVLAKENGLGLLPLAFGQKPLFIQIQKGQVFKSPLQILHLVFDQEALWIAPLLFFQIEADGFLEVLQETVDLTGSAAPIFLPALNFFLKPRAQVSCTNLNLNSSFWSNVFYQVFLGEKADFSFSNFSAGGDLELQDLKACLKKESRLQVNSLNILKEKRQSYFQSLVEHEEKSFSSQLYKSVLEDSSRFFLEGVVAMAQQAEGSEGAFFSQNLFLSSKAQFWAKPALRIMTDDVKARHGVFSRALLEEELFYLQSRGIRERAARSSLTEGFCQEVSKLIKIGSAVKSVEEAFFL